MDFDVEDDKMTWGAHASPPVIKGRPSPDKQCVHTWTPAQGYEFVMVGHCIQSFISSAAEDITVVANKRRCAFSTGPDESSTVCNDGLWVFSLEGKLYQYEISWAADTHTISGKHPVDTLVQRIDEELRLRNPIRNKHAEFIARPPHGLEVRLRRQPCVSLDDVVLEPKRCEDIFNNTIFHLDQLEGNNGLIFHGPPGTGKSITCQALIGEALRRGYSACYVVGRPNFDELDHYLDRYFGTTLLIFEDIDSFAEDRVKARGHYLSDFLQFLSGLSERRDKLVVIATTNHINLLDEAIRHRPVRFNRRYLFDYPTDTEIVRLFQHHFKDHDLSGFDLNVCQGRQLTGAHVREIHRTTEMYRQRYELPLAAAFERAVETLLGEFGGTAKELCGAGFG